MAIEISIKEVDGVKFLSNIHILSPDDKVNGVDVHRISAKLLQRENGGEFLRAISLLGLRRVDYDPVWRSYLYAQYPMSYWWYKTIKLLLQTYWKTVMFLYDNARLFKQIPPSESFSWRYFTLYCWIKGK